MDLTLRQCKSCTVEDAIIVAIIGIFMLAKREGENERERERERERVGGSVCVCVREGGGDERGEKREGGIIR